MTQGYKPRMKKLSKITTPRRQSLKSSEIEKYYARAMMHHIWCIQILFSEIALSAFLGLLHTKFELNLHAKLHAHSHASARARTSTQMHIFNEFWKVTSRQIFFYCPRAMMHHIWCMVSNFNTPYMVHRFWSETKRFRYFFATFRHK